jgi:hypothetical protein
MTTIYDSFHIGFVGALFVKPCLIQLLADRGEALMPGWYFIVILSAIGGQRKSLFTELVALILRSRGCKIEVFSADVAERLADKLGSVTKIDTDLLDASDDPLALLRAFSPLSNALDQAVTSGSSIVLDTAATWDVTVLRFLRDMDVDN